MAALSKHSKVLPKTNSLLKKLQADYPEFSFIKGANYRWSPNKKRITYTFISDEIDQFALLHEVAHASLGHEHFVSDFDLLQLEIAAWKEAQNIAQKYSITIDDEHIQDCLDSYRDWLHSRAKCPHCSVVSLQRPDGLYQCFNCKTTWQVPTSQACRITKSVIPPKRQS
jgi:hypothetical protein